VCVVCRLQNLGAAPFKQLMEILVRCPVPQPMPEITDPVPLPKKHKLRKIIRKVQIKKEKADRERKEKKDKERKEREHQREVRKEQRAADLEKERSERQRQKEILHQEIRRVGGNVSQIEKREPPPVPSRASKPARRTVGSGTSPNPPPFAFLAYFLLTCLPIAQRLPWVRSDPAIPLTAPPATKSAPSRQPVQCLFLCLIVCSLL